MGPQDLVREPGAGSGAAGQRWRPGCPPFVARAWAILAPKAPVVGVVLHRQHQLVGCRPVRATRGLAGSSSGGRPRKPPPPGPPIPQPPPGTHPPAGLLKPTAPRRRGPPAAGRRGRSAAPPGCRRRWSTLGYRMTVGPSVTSTASRSSSLSRAGSRGAATWRPGMTGKIDASHMPWWLAPSGPVTPGPVGHYGHRQAGGAQRP